MSESDSIQSSDNNPGTDETINTAVNSNYKTSQQNEIIHGYFIPVVMVVVLCVIIVATFYTTEFNNLLTSLTSTHQSDRVASDIKTGLHATADSVDQPRVSAAPNATTAADERVNESNQEAIAIIESDVSDTTSTTDTSASGTVADNALSARSSKVAALENLSPYPVGPDYYVYPLAPPTPYGMPGRFQHAQTDRMDNRRKARIEHMKKMQEYRATVMKRIEQDRRDMYKHMLQQIEVESPKSQDKLLIRYEPSGTSIINRPI